MNQNVDDEPISNFLFLYLFFSSEIRKVLSKIGKEKECEAVNEWIKPCENHLHWSATSTFSGNGLVIWAKFKSFLRHIVNQHSNHSDPLFNNCAHGSDIPARKWLTIGKSWCVCMYACMHVCMYACMYVCNYTYSDLPKV